jgi:diphosphoinositol-polyphosphate diphosphatase
MLHKYCYHATLNKTIWNTFLAHALHEKLVKLKVASIQGAPLGEWIFKSKSKQSSCGQEGSCKGFMFALQVTELLESWPEQITHGRRWVSMSHRCRILSLYVQQLLGNWILCISVIQVPVREVDGLCRYDWMREALDKLKEQLVFGSNFSAPPSLELPDSSSLCMVVSPAVPQGAVALC